jgi:flagellin
LEISAMSMSLNANKSAPASLGVSEDKLDQPRREPQVRDEAAVYAPAPRADVSSLGALKDSLDRAASSARLAVIAVEQVGELLNQMREKVAGDAAISIKALEDDHRALVEAIGRVEALAAPESGEGSLGLAPRDFALGGPIINLDGGTAPALDLAIGRVTSALAEMDAEAGQIEKHVALVARLQDMLAKRIGGLVDADLDEEAARLQALQVQQQLGAHALSLANSRPQVILELFRGE